MIHKINIFNFHVRGNLNALYTLSFEFITYCFYVILLCHLDSGKHVDLVSRFFSTSF